MALLKTVTESFQTAASTRVNQFLTFIFTLSADVVSRGRQGNVKLQCNVFLLLEFDVRSKGLIKISGHATMDKIQQYIDDNKDAFLKQWFEVLRIPSVSAQREHKDDMKKTASWLVSFLTEKLGMSARTISTDGNPLVYGESPSVPNAPTVMLYGHYDVMPSEPDDAWFTMHSVTYRTQILKDNNVTLTEHCFYTDQEYDLLPLRWVNTIRVAPVTVYCYRIGRGEQSISLSGLEKHYNEQTIVLKRLYNVYSDVFKRETKKDNYIYKYFGKRTRFQIRTYLIISKSKQHKQELVDFVEYLKSEQPEIYKRLLMRKSFKLLVWTNYAAYGILHHLMLKKYRY